MVVPDLGGAEDPVVGRVWTTGRPVPPEVGGVTMGRPGEVGVVTPDRGSVLGSLVGVCVTPVPRFVGSVDPGGVIMTDPPPDTVRRHPESPFTPGIVDPGAPPPERFAAEPTVPVEFASSLG